MVKADTISPFEKSIGQRIGQIRTVAGESQQQLANAIGVSRPIIQHWESGTRHIKADHLIALSDHFDVTVDFLIGRSDNPSKDKNIQEICEYTGLSQWSVEELHSCANNPEQKDYIEIINALLENTDYFHSMASMACHAAEARTMWRLLHDNGVAVHDPEIWNEANRVLTIADISAQEYSPFNFLSLSDDQLPDNQGTQVLLPAGSWFLTSSDAADYFIGKATELFRDIIDSHIDEWNLWPNLAFGEAGAENITVQTNPIAKEGKNGEHQED